MSGLIEAQGVKILWEHDYWDGPLPFTIAFWGRWLVPVIVGPVEVPTKCIALEAGIGPTS